MGDPAAKAELFDSLARVGKALGSGKRLELIDLLAQGERSVDALADAAGLGVTTCSAHLQTLRQAGLVRTRKAGTRVFHSLAGDDIARLFADVRAVAQAHLAETERARLAYLGGEDVEEVRGRTCSAAPGTGTSSCSRSAPWRSTRLATSPAPSRCPSTTSPPGSPTCPRREGSGVLPWRLLRARARGGPAAACCGGGWRRPDRTNTCGGCTREADRHRGERSISRRLRYSSSSISPRAKRSARTSSAVGRLVG